MNAQQKADALVAQSVAKTDEISRKYENIMNPKKRVGRGSTLTYLDDPSGGFGQIQLLEARLSALEKFGRDYLSERDKRNGYSPHSVARMVLCQILAMYRDRANLIKEKGEDGMTDFEKDSGLSPVHVLQELLEQVEKTKQRINNMDAEQITPPLSGDQANETPRGGNDETEKLKRTLDAMLELRKARESIVAQLTEVRTQAKSKISALKSAEDALLDECEGVNQMKLFEIDPSVSPEVREIIENPVI